MSDPDGDDQIRGVVIWDYSDAPSSTHLALPPSAGQVWVWRGSWQLESGAQLPGETYVFLSTAQFNNLEIVGGATPGTEYLWAIPYDGTVYGTSWAGVTVTTTGVVALQVAALEDGLPPLPPVPEDPSLPVPGDFATDGDDVLIGGPGRSGDTIFGLAGNDDISGLGGPDELRGGRGNDTLVVEI
jgi:Ca2+-binding RTX toxin-like protein